MAKELVVPDDGGDLEFRAWYETLVDIRETAREMKYDLAENLKQARDRGYDKRLGYTRFEDFVADYYGGLSKEAAYQYIRIAENVLGALPEDVCTALTGGFNPLPLKLLAALHFDNIAPQEVERIRKLEPEQQREELLKLGYDRERMGGRAASDLLRKRMGKKSYRDQSRKIQVLREKYELKDSENHELTEQYKALQARLDQVLEAIENPAAAKTVKTLDALTARLAELEKKSAEAEAEIAVGKEVGTRALILSGEIQALLSQFEDGVRIDKKGQWVEVRAILHSAQDAVEQTLGRMAEVIIARVDSGEITRFSVEDPEGESGAAAEGLSEPGSRRR